MEPQDAIAPQDNEARITLGLLSAGEEDNAVTQRTMSRKRGIALGLTNAYLKRSVRKGYIKVTEAPANRYAYYLTPRGFAEKSRLTAQFFTISFNFFRSARDQCSEAFAQCAERGWSRVLLAGVSDLGEIATLCVNDNGLTLVGIYDPTHARDEFAGLPVIRSLDGAPAFDAVAITDFIEPQKFYDELVAVVDPERILAPRLLDIAFAERPRSNEPGRGAP